MSRDPTPIRVLFIAGAGRSGSTVLDTVLGNHPAIVGLGELRRLYDAGWIDDEFCACGERVSGCPMWRAVRRGWVERLGRDDVAGALAALRQIERQRYRLLFPGRPRWPDAVFRRYAADTLALLQSIRAVTGAEVLLDSSKSSIRGLALSAIEGVDLRVLHLVRDGRGVAWSLKRPQPKDERGGVAKALPSRPVARTALFWLVANLTAERLARLVGSAAAARLRYEDFVAEPTVALAEAGRLAGVDLGDVAARAAAGEAMTVGHTVAGNRVRMKGQIRLRLDEAWRRKLSARDQALFRLVAWPMLRRYGYRR